MHLDPIMPVLTGAALAIVLVGLVLRRLRQPPAVGYLLAGLILGPDVLGLLKDPATVERLGAIGVVLLLFFVGMEVSPRLLIDRWRIAALGTTLQVVVSVALVAGLGAILDWPLSRILLIGFGVSLSSTAIVIKLLRSWKEADSEVAGDVTAILLAQDLAIAPMLIVLQLSSGQDTSIVVALGQVVACVAFLGAALWLAQRGTFRLPLGAAIGQDPELQIFVALAVCFGLALVTGFLGLSAALGAFLAGMVVRSAEQTHWVERSLRPFETVFVAIFFLSVGMLIDLDFLRDEWRLLALLLAVVLLTNTGLNAVVLRLFGCSWRHSLYAGSLLSQIGEFSFVLAALGLHAGIITGFAHQALIATISLSLLVCPAWIALLKRFVRPR